MTVTRCRTIPSPVGPLTLAGRDEVLTNLCMEDQTHSPRGRADWVRDDGIFPKVVDQLDAYFAGELTDFDVEIDLLGTPFQKRVWSALLDIPYGATASYGDVAAAIGQPTACRAVGMANGRNPVAIIVPCHRVIGSGGTLTGYAGGLDRKRILLDLERRRPGP
ncbi:MAG TPA: methylated-DNA--[protein]-cysteine S-methyltransferase [Acidimicrobiales bacterium]|nr:methylated-DNA--[protein]-cysteine S-methyltransferase [Acidimicrobiales bacterium]